MGLYGIGLMISGPIYGAIAGLGLGVIEGLVLGVVAVVVHRGGALVISCGTGGRRRWPALWRASWPWRHSGGSYSGAIQLAFD